MFWKKLLFAVISIFIANASQAQILIHSHNDYDHAHPFWGAFREKANSIEADVFPVQGQLLVAHAKSQADPGRTLEKLYLNPIIDLFRKHQNKTVSDDTGYTFYLMIDIKEKWDRVLPLLEKKLKLHPACFDRTINPMAVRVFISGERPPETTFPAYPSLIMFDGLPAKQYTPAELRKIVMISTDFHLYSQWNGEGTIPVEDAGKLRLVIQEAHKMNKPVRFWGAPDTPACWKALVSLGVDVINTDHVKECKGFLSR